MPSFDPFRSTGANSSALHLKLKSLTRELQNKFCPTKNLKWDESLRSSHDLLDQLFISGILNRVFVSLTIFKKMADIPVGSNPFLLKWTLALKRVRHYTRDSQMVRV